MSEAICQLDRDIDPHLAALEELCRLMLAAKQHPNDWKCHPLGVRFDADLQRFVRQHGFEVRWSEPYPNAASIRWVGA